MKKLTKTLLLTVALSAGLSMPAMAANVQATLPTFPVTLNGTAIDNSYRQYPLLVYNNITYFPMTYYDCRFLGVETEWTQANGLKIEKASLTGAYHADNSNKKNGKTATAQVATGKITVNGKTIANSKEKYPLLVYRDVTYFPLTWNYAVNEFGWQYSYDNQKGLVIDAGNTKTSSVTLKDARVYEKSTGLKFDFAADGQYLYYEGKKGNIYRRPLVALQDDKQCKTLLSLDKTYTTEDYPQCGFQEEGGSVYLRYHMGGAIMGSDYLQRLSGTPSENLLTYQADYYKDFGGFQIRIPISVVGGPGAEKLIRSTPNGTQQIGADGWYYVAGGYGENSFSAGGGCVDYWNGMFYSLGFAVDSGMLSHICSIDPVSGKTTVLSQYPAWKFECAGGMIYYLCAYRPEGTVDPEHSQRYLYGWDLTTNKEQYIGYVGSSEKSYSTLYAACANGVYYRSQEKGDLLFWNKHTGKTETINVGFRVLGLESQNGYVMAQFEEVPKNPYRLLVLAPSGQGMKQVYATADCSDKAVVNANGLLVYRLEETSQLVQVQL